MKMVITSLLLSTAFIFSGCKDDNDNYDGVNQVIGDLVAIDIPIAGVSDVVAPSFTRGLLNDTVRFTHEINDSLVLESVLTPTASAATRTMLPATSLKENTTVLMVDYQDDILYKYQLLTVDATNKFTVYLTAGESHTLLFYSLGDTHPLDVSNYISYTGTPKAVDPDGDGPLSADGIYGYLLPVDAALNQFAEESGGDATTNGNDAMYAKITTPVINSNTPLDNIIFKHLFSCLTWEITSKNKGFYVTGCKASFGPTYKRAYVSMDNLYTMPVPDNVSDLYYFWMGVPGANKTKIPFRPDLSSNTKLTVESLPCIFIPTDATSTLSINLTSLTMGDAGEVIKAGDNKIVKITGVKEALQSGTSYKLTSTVNRKEPQNITIKLRGADDGKSTVGGSISVSGKKKSSDLPSGGLVSAATLKSPFWFSGWYQIDKNGMTRKIGTDNNLTPNVSIDAKDSKKLIIKAIDEKNEGYTYEARIIAWAKSNIYWDGKGLTFKDEKYIDDPSSTKNACNYQGVFFLWGSLVGISPGEKYWDYTSIPLYLPDSQSPTTALAMGWSSFYDNESPYTGIPSLQGIDFSVPGWGELEHRSTQYLIDRLDASAYPNSAYIGDICARLSPGWRMPTSCEFDSQSGDGDGGWSGEWSITYSTWNPPRDGSTVIGAKTEIIVGRGTILKSESSGFMPAGVTRTPTNLGYAPVPAIHFPAAGHRDFNGTLQYTCRSGYYWSSSVNSTSTISCSMYFNGYYMYPVFNDERYFAYSVRCVREY